MPERKPSAILEDILTCIDHIQSYTSGLSIDQFSSHFMTVEACLYNLQVIGEAVSVLPQQMKDENKNIQWAAIKGMRNRLVHACPTTGGNILVQIFSWCGMLYRMNYLF